MVQNQSNGCVGIDCSRVATLMCLILTPTIKVTFHLHFQLLMKAAEAAMVVLREAQLWIAKRILVHTAVYTWSPSPHLSRPPFQQLAKLRRWKGNEKAAFLHFKGGKTNLGEPSAAIYQDGFQWLWHGWNHQPSFVPVNITKASIETEKVHL